ncbi:hypothetical protein BJV77DRAFT_1061430 [Russula vinacea]|nr:hypothetical protein BJV77DRAFT_1061430 [Russula vinacea]
MRPQKNPCPLYPCLHPGCKRWFKTPGGRTCHTRSKHPPETHQYRPPTSSDGRSTERWELDGDVPAQVHSDRESAEHRAGENEHRPKFVRIFHPIINGQICDKDGHDIPPGTPPTIHGSDRGPDDWTPYSSPTLLPHGDNPPFGSPSNLYSVIDSTPLGDVPWENFAISYNGHMLENPNDAPPWTKVDHEVWFRDPRKLVKNMLANPDFNGEFDTTPFHEYDADNKHRFQNFMSGNWAWSQADIIADYPGTHGSMFVPIILGSDKTTVSVATGHNEFWPVYLSIGNIHNSTRRAQRNGVVLLGLLPIPHTDKDHQDSALYRKFRRQLFHSSLSGILQPLEPGMTKPEIVRCPDGHFRRVIYGLGPYIADYPEQALLACIVQGWCAKCMARAGNLDGEARLPRHPEHTMALIELVDLNVMWNEYGLEGDVVAFTEDFPRADIHELLAPDILHQLIKGTFKDHLVTWVNDYLFLEHGERRAEKIVADIDRRIAAVAPFSGLRRFPQGRGFKQWTGDDSKALMKVYLPAIKGHVPVEMVRALRAFLEFCYIARRDVHDTASLQALKDALDKYHRYRQIFQTTGVRPTGFNLPRQHSLVHYFKLIRAFGAPNGLCSSITESKHIKAIKEPWRRSNRYNAMEQMLLTNQRLDKLAASRVDFEARGMLKGSLLSSKRNVDASELAETINQPDFVDLIRRFLQDQLSLDANTSNSSQPLPFFNNPISVYSSSTATFYSPSDPCGTVSQERYDCVLVETDPDAPGMLGLDVARVRLFFSFSYRGKFYPYEDTGMWIVERELNADGSRRAAVLHLDTIVRAAHLIGVYGESTLPNDLSPAQSLESFQSYYVNKYIDHHSFETLF